MSSVLDHGAVPGAPTLQTAALQAALDAAAAAGGGTVVVPPGVYRTATLRLRDHVTLHLENGARLLGSDNLADYPDLSGGFTDAVGQRRGRGLIYAERVVGAAITGLGVIDGNGGAFAFDQPDRPFLVRFVDCTDVVLSGVHLRDSAAWVLHLLGCDLVRVDGLRIHSHVNGNNDGIDLDSCRRVRISGCDIDTGDDAICLKATRATPTEHVVVTGCVIRSIWGALKLGTESAGDFRHIVISDCVIRDTCGGGIKLISMDGARMEHVQISNITFDRVSGPIFIRLGARLRRYHADQPERPVGCIRDVTLRNISGTVWEEGYLLYGKLPRKSGVIVTGLPDHPIENLRIEGLNLRLPGGETVSPASIGPVPEQPAEYPEFPCFHPLPAWGLFLRHARGVLLRDVRLAAESPDSRPERVTDDVEGLVVE